MRRGLLATALFVVSVGATSAQTNPQFEVFFAQNIRPHVEAYNSCAVQHLIGLARIDPSRAFDQIEITLRPACGFHMDRIKEAFARVGFSSPQVNGVINKIYKGGAAFYQAAYEKEAIGEIGRRRAAQAEEVDRQHAARVAEQERQRTNEADAERRKVFQAAVDEHMACLRKQMADIVPYSNETAETLAGVINTKCAEFEQKRVSLGIALFGVGRADAERVTKEAVEDAKKQVVAEIVTFRAERTKAMMSAPKPASAPSVNNGI